ncbi:MAG TPA: FAD synthase, partial [Candidatus Wirthbacteria bacterium]|nr:FAD synthase [Candidatus Wirthbacteria bacterium]
MPNKPVIVLATGVFDIIHPGHLFYLSEARKLGDILHVVIACDQTTKVHGKKPIFSQTDRLKLVSALKLVDQAHLGNPSDHLGIVK